MSRGFLTTRADVEFRPGWGIVQVNVPSRHLRVTRQCGGTDEFRRHSSHLAAARTALCLFLCWPIVSWVLQYVWLNKGVNGITGAFAIGIVQSAEDWLIMLLAHPVRGATYLCFLAVLSRLARS